jgi:riboflavin synthase
MFTGIITDRGRLRALTESGEDRRFEIETAYDTSAIPLGASIACSGACLTAVEFGPGWFAADVSAETLACTTLGAWQVGHLVNLERPLSVGAELGGHMVLGHVDGVAEVLSRRPDGASARFALAAPAALAGFVASKGSVTLDGVSLTVNEVDGNAFGVNIIPHTLDVTGFGALEPGMRVNLEVDVLARYVARLREAGAT